ncbi:MAG: J domain-containing protein [Acidimicrobiales bacterium]
MGTVEAARILGVAVDAPGEELRAAYLREIRAHHPDRAGPAASDRASTIIAAYRLLVATPHEQRQADAAPPPPPPTRQRAPRPPLGRAPDVHRIDADALLLDAPADETLRWLVDAAHDVGEITYIDRSMPILEVLCRFVDEPATSLLLTLQGRGLGTEVFCTVESIEARPAPPTAAVVDLLELALHRRSVDGPGGEPPQGP